GVELQWDYRAETSTQLLAARTHVNLTRILREAVSNALKHAAPAKISVTVKVGQDIGEIVIVNDGHANPAGLWAEGNGCRIVRQRAREIGGDLTWKVAQECTLTLTLPLTQS